MKIVESPKKERKRKQNKNITPLANYDHYKSINSVANPNKSKLYLHVTYHNLYYK